MRSILGHTTFVVAIILISITSGACAQRVTPAANFSGVWEGKLTLDGLDHSFTLAISARDSTVTGTLSDDCWVVRDHVCAEARSLKITRPRVAGDTLTFLVDQLEFSAVRDGATLRLAFFNPYDGSNRAFIASIVHRNAS